MRGFIRNQIPYPYLHLYLAPSALYFNEDANSEFVDIICMSLHTGFWKQGITGKRGAGLDSPFATLLLVALPDSSSLLAVTPSIVWESILYLNVTIVVECHE